MSVALLVMTDGRRDCIAQSIPSALANLDAGLITRRVICDDSDSVVYRDWLRATFPEFEVIYHSLGRRGFAGAIWMAWSYLSHGDERFVFHLEDDFTFNRPVQLAAMAAVLDANDEVIQLALRRQPWNDHERLAGGIVEQHPDAYHEENLSGSDVLLHRLFFTTNPSLYRRSLCAQGWPEGANSEGHFTHQILQADPDAWFAYWGARDSGEWVTHTGTERVGTGY